MNKICSKCRAEKTLEEFNRNSSKGDGRQSYCRICANKAVKIIYKEQGPLRREKQKVWDRARKERAHMRIIEYLSNHPCIDCGESDILVLQFDHIIPVRCRDRVLGRNNITQAMFDEEITKCEVRCANCHLKKHRHDNNDFKYRYIMALSSNG